MAKLEDNKKALSAILAEMFEEVLDVRNNSVETIVNEERFLKAIPVPSVNGVEAQNIENNLTEANKEAMLKIMDESYRRGDYGKLMRFLTYAFPLTYANNGTITTMYNSLRKQLGKHGEEELSYEDLRKLFSAGKPLEKLIYDSGTLAKQFLKKNRKQILTETDILRFIIKGYQVADFYENHTAEMEHFRRLQDHFYVRNKGGYSKVDVEMLNELEDNGYDDIILLRQMFDKGGSKDSQSNKLYTSDISSPSTALDSIEMRNVVEADEVIRSMFIAKYVKEALSSGKDYTPSFDNIEKDDKELFTEFMTLEGEDINSILCDDVKMYAKNIKALVDRLFRNKEDLVMHKPFLAKSGEDGWVAEPYSNKELKAHKQTIIDAIINSAIRHGAFTTSSKEDFMNKIAIACTDKIVTKHFNHSSLNGFAMDENGEPIDFTSSFVDATVAPYSEQNRKCAAATINYGGKLYFVSNIPAVPSGKSDNVADDEWKLSITDQELKALIVKLSNTYGTSFCDLTRENILIQKNGASVEASRMALGDKAKINIETAFEIMKTCNVQRENENPYIQSEDLVADLTAFENSPFYLQAYNKEREKYAHLESIADFIKMALTSKISSIQDDYQENYMERQASIENDYKSNKAKRDEKLLEEAVNSEAEYKAQEIEPDVSPLSMYTEKLTPEEVNRGNVEILEPTVVVEPKTQASEEVLLSVETKEKITETTSRNTPIDSVSVQQGSIIFVVRNGKKRGYSVLDGEIINVNTGKKVSGKTASEILKMVGKSILKTDATIADDEKPVNIVPAASTQSADENVTTKTTRVKETTTIVQKKTTNPFDNSQPCNSNEEPIEFDKSGRDI